VHEGDFRFPGLDEFTYAVPAAGSAQPDASLSLLRRTMAAHRQLP
jgi:hypothetical protein